MLCVDVTTKSVAMGYKSDAVLTECLLMKCIKRLFTNLMLAVALVVSLTNAIAQSYITPSSPEWAFLTETATGSGAFVNGPGTPPSGSPGSIQLTVANPGGQFFFTQQYSGVRLDQIAGLSYNSYVVSATVAETATLQFDFDPGVTPPNYAGYQGRAVFIPSLVSPVQIGQWQQWNPMTQRAWIGSGSAATRVLAAACTFANPCTWSQILLAFPNSKVLANSSFGFKLGNSFNAAVVSVDSFKIGTAGVTGAINQFNFAIAPPLPPPPPPSPTAPTNLVCTSTGYADINCRFNQSTTTSANPILSYRLYCLNESASIAIQTAVTPTETTAALSNAPIGRYRCNVTAQGTTSASELSNLARLVLTKVPLSLSTQFSPDGTGFGAILVRSNSSGTSSTSVIGRFDGARFNFTSTNDPGNQWRALATGDVVNRNQSSVISRSLAGDVRLDTDTSLLPVSALLRKAQLDWALESVIDLDGDGRADMVWRYMKPGSNDSGVIFAWFSASNDAASVSISDVIYRGGAPLSWSLIGGMDINGDGKGDLIWLSPSNDIRSLTSTSRRGWLNERIGAIPVGYNIEKLGDLNGDGKGDIVFKDVSGKVKIWLMDGTRIVLAADLPALAATTSFYAAGDFDGDGAMDIVWKKADNTLVVWLMNKAVINQPTIIDNAGVAPAGLVVE
jgi:FG-GAP-like repeat